MSPTFVNGDYVVTHQKNTTRYCVGDAVIITHDIFNPLIKRIEKLEGNSVWVSGDNPSSVSMEKIGRLPIQNIIGKVVFRISKKTPHLSFRSDFISCANSNQ